MGVIGEEHAVAANVVITELAKLKVWNEKKVAGEFNYLLKAGRLVAYKTEKSGKFYLPDFELEEEKF